MRGTFLTLFRPKNLDGLSLLDVFGLESKNIAPTSLHYFSGRDVNRTRFRPLLQIFKNLKILSITGKATNILILFTTLKYHVSRNIKNHEEIEQILSLWNTTSVVIARRGIWARLNISIFSKCIPSIAFTNAVFYVISLTWICETHSLF